MGMTKSWFGRKEVRQALYAVLAALLCFIGPTYFVAVLSRLIPQTYAMVLGLISFLIGIFVVVKLVKD
ncbi:MAG: hypothetical protein JSV51_06575 [Candidatus Bathyarchaeota archaeon]|nr:MAG: hypothetical protein JSV51_06575 [Candidatus Bathyarchaeota archaeon]